MRKQIVEVWSRSGGRMKSEGGRKTGQGSEGWGRVYRMAWSYLVSAATFRVQRSLAWPSDNGVGQGYFRKRDGLMIACYSIFLLGLFSPSCLSSISAFYPEGERRLKFMQTLHWSYRERGRLWFNLIARVASSRWLGAERACVRRHSRITVNTHTHTHLQHHTHTHIQHHIPNYRLP